MHILFAAIAFLIVVLVGPASAARCDDLRANWAKFVAELKDMTAQLDKANTNYALPHKNHTICRALVHVQRDSVLVIAEMETECFQSEGQKTEYEKKAEGFGSDAAKLSSGYCTDAEYKAIMTTDPFSK
jgi:hypothetical protein